MEGLIFERPDRKRFPALRIAYAAAETGGSAPAVLSGANEEAVRAFLSGQIAFTDIVRVVDRVLSAWSAPFTARTLQEVLAADAQARREAQNRTIPSQETPTIVSPILQFIYTIVPFIVVLGILIFVHEFGHFIVARKLGVGVTKFSFGFGPKLAGFQRGETEYLLSAVPLGGYVKLVGESEGEEVPPEQLARSFQRKPTWVKMAIVAAGPLGNLVFAILVFWVVFLGGVPSLTTRIGDIAPDTPASRAGLLKGDVVLRIDGATVATWEDLAAKIRTGNSGRPLRITVKRDGSETTIPVAPEMREGRTVFGEKVSEPKIGIVAGQEVVYRKIGPGAAFVRAGQETGKLIYLTVMTVVKLVTRVLPSETLGGRSSSRRSRGTRRARGSPLRLLPRPAERQPRNPQPASDPDPRRRAPALLLRRGADAQADLPRSCARWPTKWGSRSSSP